MEATPGTGTNGASTPSDYTATDATLTFNPADFTREEDDDPWTAVKTWPINILDDTADEDVEHLTVSADPDTGTGPSDLTVNIRDNEVGLKTLTLTLPSTALDQTVDPSTTTYTASTPSTVTSVQINPTATHSGTAEVEGTNPRTLNTGDNEVTINTVAEDTTTKVAYTLTVRKLSAEPSLKSLTISNATDGQETTQISTNPSAFDPDVTSYTAVTTSQVTHVSLVVVTTHDDATVTYSSGGEAITDPTSIELEVGDTVITILVTPEDTDADTRTYTLTITRQSGDATLSALMVTPLIDPGLDPIFTPLTMSYTGTALNSTASITVSATASSNEAEVSFPPSTTTTKGSGSTTVTLSNGPNPVPVKVTSQDQGEDNTYTVTVNRLGPLVSIVPDDPEITEGDTASFTLTRTGNLAGAQDVPVDITLDDDDLADLDAAFDGVQTTTKFTQDTVDNPVWNADSTLRAEIQDGE